LAKCDSQRHCRLRVPLTHAMEGQARQPLVTEPPPSRESVAESAHLEEGVEQHRSGSFVSRIENRVPVEYAQRSWGVADAQGEARAPSFDASDTVPKEAERQEHTCAVEVLRDTLKTDLDMGLSGQEARERLLRNGPNTLTPPPRTPAVVKFLQQLISGFAPILWFAALLCFMAYWPLGNRPPQEADNLNLSLALVLVGVIMLQASFNFYQEYKSDCIMEQLTAMIPLDAMVKRGGQQVSVPVSDLVVGDIVTISGGDKVPADVRLISVKDLKVDKSTLNGESEPVKCCLQCSDNNFLETKNLAFFGCSAVEGTGVGVVIATGNNTVFGDIARMAGSQSSEPSTLHQEINRFVIIIAVLSLSTGIVAFLGWFAWLRVKHPDFLALNSQIVNCISLIVAFVPEGMPVAVTVTLALIAADMSRSNVLVKNLGVVETLGSVSVIASDKTGTLTENRMTVSELSHAADAPAHKELLRAMVLCNRAVCGANDEIIGDASDSGLFRHYCQAAASGAAPEAEAMRREHAKLAELPFNSTNKYMLSIHELPGEGDRLLLLKGAPERMLDRCSTLVTASGVAEPLVDNVRTSTLRSIEEAAARGQRILGFCRSILPESKYGADFAFDLEEPNFPTSELAFLGWVALRDPPRAGVREAIEQCHRAHVRVAMVTGDHPATAKAIAQQVGIVGNVEVDDAQSLGSQQCRPSERAVVLTGSDLERLQEVDWQTVCRYRQAVFARTTPKQKLQIVKAFQSRGECVAVTGDGVNDAPALKQANCGLAMGSGSEVSKEAADLVVLDDNFASVVKGIEHGRRCFANLKKVIIYLLPAGSFSEMLPVMTNVFLGMPLALSSFLMIVICCFTDVGPSLALVYEKSESRLMEMKPRRLGRDRLVDWKLLLNAYLFIGIMEAGVAYATFFVYYAYDDESPGTVLFTFGAPSASDEPSGLYGEMQNVGQCLYFYALVVMQFGNAFTSRTAMLPIWRHNPFKGPTKNLRIFAAILVSTTIFSLTCYVPFIQDSLQTRALPGFNKWLALLLPWFGAALLIGINESRKAWAERFPEGRVAMLAW